MSRFNAVLVLMVSSLALGQTKPSKPKPVKHDYSEQIAICKAQVEETNKYVENREKERIDLLTAAETRLLTAAETKKLLDWGEQIYVGQNIESCDETGAIWGAFSQPYYEEEVHKKFLDLLFQQARFRSLEK